MADVVDGDVASRLVSVDGVIGRPAGFVLVGQIYRYCRIHHNCPEREESRQRQGLALIEQIGDSGAAYQEPDRRRRLRE